MNNKEQRLDLTEILIIGWVGLMLGYTALEFFIPQAGMGNLAFLVILIICLVNNTKKRNERGASGYVKALIIALFAVFVVIVLLDSILLPQTLFMSLVAFGAIGIASVISGAYIILTSIKRRREDELSRLMQSSLYLRIFTGISFLLSLIFLFVITVVFEASSQAELNEALPYASRSFVGFSFKVVFTGVMSLLIGLAQLRNVPPKYA